MQEFLQRVRGSVYLFSKRGLLVVSCAVLLFSVVQVSVLSYTQQRAAALTNHDPMAVLGQGKTPRPLASAQSEQTDSLDAVAKEVRSQAQSQASDLRHGGDALKDAKEDTAKRTETSRTFVQKNGTQVVEYGAQNAGYTDKNGKLHAIDPKLTEDSNYINNVKQQQSNFQKLKFWDKPQAYTGTGGPLTANFKPLSTQEGVKVGLENQSITMRPLNATPDVKPKEITNKDGTKAIIYEDVWNGVDVVYEYRGEAVKEMIVLRKPTDHNRFGFEVSGANIQLKHAKDGGVEVYKDAKPVFVIPAITVMVTERGPVSNSGAKYEIQGNRLTVSLDKIWLSKQDKKQFPITIDPTVSVHESWEGVSGNGSNYWSYKSDGYQCPSSSCYQNIGWLNDNGTKKWQTMMRIPFDQAVDKDLLYAQFNVQKVSNSYGWYGTEASQRYWVTWAPCFGFGCVNGGAPWIGFTITDHGWIDVTSLIQWMKDHGQTGGWLMVHGDDSAYKALNPGGSTLQLYYNRKPNKPSGSTPAHESIITTTMPRLTAATASDPDGDALSYQFEIYDGNTLIASSPTTDLTAWNVPESLLQDGGSYQWRVGVRDSWGWSYSNTYKFTIDTRIGNKDKTQTYDAFGDITSNLANGNVYTSVQSHSIDALGGDIGLNLEYNSPHIGQQGLSATYYNDAGGRKKVLKRTDPTIHFNWGSSSPAPGIVSADSFAVNWEGYFIAPSTGAYQFGGTNDDQMSASIDTNGDGSYEMLFDYGCCQSQKWSTTTVQLEEGKAYPLRAWMIEAGGAAYAELWVKAPGRLGQVVPQSWLRTAELGKAVDDKQGLRAEFYKDYDGSRTFKANQQPYLVKNFSEINLYWGEGSSVEYDPDGDYKDNFLTRFTGYITIPTTGSYSFGVAADDGKRLYINGTKVAEYWSSLDHAWSGSMNFNAGDIVPIMIEHYEAGGSAAMQLKWDGAAGAGVIPAQYLSTSYRDLPAGWNLSLDADDSVTYERLRVLSGGNVALIGGDGTHHTYTANGGGYTPPTDQDGVLSKNSDGSYSFQDVSGRVYEFAVNGVLTRVTAPTDDRNPAALKYEYQDTNGVPRVKKIIDGVDSQRYGELFYGGDSQCQTAAGFDPTPAGFLCAFKTYDGQITNLYYSNDRIARVVLPGGEITDLGNDTFGRVTSIRDALANDAITTGTRNNNDELLTQLTYDAVGRLKSIKIPAAQAGEQREEHTVEYGFGKTKRHVAGASEPHGYSQYIEYDETGRTTKACDQQALCVIQEWHPRKDLLLSTTDALGMKSTTIYDEEDRPVSSYGAAPKDWFDSWEWSMPAGKVFTRGQFIKSPDGRFTFTYQTNGNLVVREVATNTPLWYPSTDTLPSDRLVMQTDGNLVLYNGSSAVWQSGTGGQGDTTSRLEMQNDGNLVLYVKRLDGSQVAKWATNAGKTSTPQFFATNYNTPKPANASQIPRADTGYDESIGGAAVSWYNFKNGKLFGSPLAHATGFNQSQTDRFWLNTTNATSPAVPVQPTDGATNVGFRATSKLHVPTTGTYTISLWHANAARVWVNDTLVLDGWSYRSNTVVSKSAQVALKANTANRLIVEYANVGGGDTAFRLELSGNGVSTPDGVWGTTMRPAYGLATSNTVYDTQIGNRRNTISYGTRPEYGLAQSTTADPNGLALTSQTSYETPGQGFLRQTSKKLPGAASQSFGYSYYGTTEIRDNPCTTEVEAFRQAGRLKIKQDADPDLTGSQSATAYEVVYDNAGREVAMRINDDPWKCITYDNRGRITKSVVPDMPGRSGRTVTTTYSFEGSPFKTLTIDSVAGSTMEVIDLLGRQQSATDEFGNVATFNYDHRGRVSSQTTPVGTEGYDYDAYDRLTAYKLGGQTYASITYDQYGRIETVTYDKALDTAGNKLKLEQIKYDALQRENGTRYRFSDGRVLDETTTLSPSAVITGVSTTFSGQTATSSYVYDGVNRLVEATVDKNKYTYWYGAQNAALCTQPSVNPNAQKNYNRTSFTHTNTATNQVLASSTACYDHADRLLASNDAQIGVPTYDSHGNTITFAGNGQPITFSYDADDTNTAIQQGNKRTEYLKDAAGTILRKKEYVDNVLAKSYRYLADGAVMQQCDLGNQSNCTSVDTYLGLPGGILLTLTPQQSDTNKQAVYSVLNFHGDAALTVGKNGIPTSSVFMYEPFGQPAVSATFGTNTSPQNSSNESMGWAADPTRKQESFSLPIVQMGARVYLPSLGRFAQVDPIEGGTQNSYVYPSDPINASDYSGTFAFAIPIVIVVIPWAQMAAAAAGAAIGTAVFFAAKAVISNLSQKATTSTNSRTSTGSQSGGGGSQGSGGGGGGGSSTSPSGGGWRGGSNKTPKNRPTNKPQPKPKPDTSIKAPNSQAFREQAQKLGFKPSPIRSHGQPMFQKGTKFITRDIDGHRSSQAWKLFVRKGGTMVRKGTYDFNLRIKIGK